PWLALSLGLIPFALIPFLPNSKKTLIVAGLCLFALLGGGLRFPSSLPPADEHSLCFYNDKETVEIQGMVAEEPDIRDRLCLLTFTASEVTVNGEGEKVSGTALIQVPRYPTYHYGDVLKITGKLETPEPFDNFDYKSYLERQGIYSVIYYPKVELLGQGEGLKPLQWIYSLRERLSASLTRALPEPQGSLAQGILLGLRGNIPDSLNQAFSRTGTAHILAISGLNISIVIAILLSLGILVFGRQRSIYIWLALGVIWLYTLLAGMNPPVIRAAIMGSLFIIAEYLGRQGSAIIALAFAAAVMVGIQPQLLWSVPFQLSFLAMAGLVFFYPYFQAWGRKGVALLFKNREKIVPTASIITDGFAASLAAIIAVGPLIAYNFGVVSLVGLPATFFSLPALPAIIATTTLVAFTGLFAPLMAQILGWLAWLFLSYFVFLVQGFDALPFSSFQVSTVSTWHIWGYYVILAGVIASLNYRTQLADFSSRLTSGIRKVAEGIPKPRLGFSMKWLVLPLLVVAILVWSVALTMPDDKLHVSFLDVGQGDAILIQTPNGQNILIDGGPDPQKINLELGEKLPFWDRTIDLVVCTQPQADHITGLVDVLQRYKVKQVLEPGVSYNSSIYQEWCNLVEEKQIKRDIARAGQEIDLGNGIKMEVLNPPASLWEGTSHDVDNNGVVLKLSWGKLSFLFTADIREEVEFELIGQRANLKSTVLKVSHHGSKTSTSQQFLAAVAPEVAVISVGTDNPFGHPSPEVVERLIDRLGEDNVYRTDEDGTIEFITDGERLWMGADS
ncbi:MAG: DNA internalization-related competence protein ComEC/Rec2, partial [Dehalococcoidia bacterium]|nr:DNA internalization-related competence protein ComEC/Rec2 [Dehalococcoidia bacterium]